MLSTRQVIDRLFRAAATGSVESVLRWWADDGVLEDVTIGKAYSGHEQLTAYLQMYYRAFPDLKYEPLQVLIDGPNALVEWAQECTFSAPFDGIPPNGRRLFLRAVDLFYISDGVVKREKSWYGDGWLRARLETSDGPVLPAPLPVLDRAAD